MGQVCLLLGCLGEAAGDGKNSDNELHDGDVALVVTKIPKLFLTIIYGDTVIVMWFGAGLGKQCVQNSP